MTKKKKISSCGNISFRIKP